MIVVVNRQIHIPTKVDYHLYKHSCLANPYTCSPTKGKESKYILKSPEDAVNAFREHLNALVSKKNKEVCYQLNRIYKMAIQGDVFIVCKCKPKPCHGDVIKKVVEANIIYDPVELEQKRIMLLRKREVIANSIMDIIGDPKEVYGFRQKMSLVNSMLVEIGLVLGT